MNIGLPKEFTINGKTYEIRSDYRVILDIFEAMDDPDLTDGEKVIVCLSIFYPGFDKMPITAEKEAYEKLCWFINGGQEEPKSARKQAKLISWKQDLPYIIGPINKASGCEIRSLEYMHWWTFLAFYMDMDGEGTFATIVRIRDKIKRGKKLDETEKRFYRENPGLVNIKTVYSEEETEALKEWIKKDG